MTFDVMIVGLGQIGMGYDLNLDSRKYIYSHASAFNSHKGFNIVGGVDVDNKLGKIFKNIYISPFYSDIKIALQQTNPDIIVIAVSTNLHYQVLKDIVKYSKTKLVLCEKPLSYCAREARSMQKICHAHNIKLFVNYMRISLPNSNKLLKTNVLIHLQKFFHLYKMILNIKNY
jgi:predicted dehydrogenase